jgi:hypothetical protein
MLLRVGMPLWALPQMSEGGFMLLCTSQGVQWQLGEEGKGDIASHQSVPFTPPAPPVAPSQRPRFTEALSLSPPFLVAPPGRAPPAIS